MGTLVVVAFSGWIGARPTGGLRRSLSRALLLGFSGAILIVVSGCSEFGAKDAPSLRGVRAFDGYRVYYAGGKVGGRPITEVFGGAEEEKLGSGAWIFIYGDCELPEGEGGCAPFQIHNYSTCSRWANLLHDDADLRPFRGAKAIYNPLELSVEIFTGRTTITISGDPILTKVALRQLRRVDQERPSRLPPPAPGSLSGKLPCQIPALKRQAELRLNSWEVEQRLRPLEDHFAAVNCVTKGRNRFLCTGTYLKPIRAAKVEFGVEGRGRPNRFATTGCRQLEPQPETEFACRNLKVVVDDVGLG